MAANSRGLYVISVAAELAGVHPQTLRIYERKGLVDPARTGGGSRRYSDLDIDRLRRILELTNAGLNLAGVKMVMELEDDLARTRHELARARDEAREAVERGEGGGGRGGPPGPARAWSWRGPGRGRGRGGSGRPASTAATWSR